MKFRSSFFRTLFGIALISVAMISCNRDEDPEIAGVADYSAEAALEWNKMFLKIERFAAGYRPGPAPRALAYMGLAAYEACVTGMPENNSLESRYSGLNIPDVEPGVEYHWPTVVCETYSVMMRKFFPSPANDIQTRMNEMEAEMLNKFKGETSQEVFDRSKAYGASVGNAVWDWSATDAYGHDAYLDPFGNYDWNTHYDGPGDWVPTYPGPGKPMYPFWGSVRTFAIQQNDKLCPPPLPYSESPLSAMYAQAVEVYTANSDAIWPNGQWIAEYWSDDLINLTFSPGPRFISIANQVIEKENSDLATALECYAKVGMALNDAAVACWYSKYYYNIERPVSYIQRIIDPNWVPSLDNPLTSDTGITPSFPAYPSGHSTMGAAGAEALTNVFGNHYGMYDNSHEGRSGFNGTPRFFNNFYEMAEENAISRVPLGVHWRMDCTEGVNLGYLCGREVNSLPWKK